jgi:3-phenylpropionate/trans-cinnamate dioxygenase ferredoxin component
VANFVKVGRADEIAPGEKQIYEVDGIEVVVVNLDGEYFCVEDVCTHDGGPLGEGELQQRAVGMPAARRALRRADRRCLEPAGL